MKRERWKLYLFIEDIAFNSNNFSKQYIEGGRDQYYERQLSTSWADLHLQPTASH